MVFRFSRAWNEYESDMVRCGLGIPAANTWYVGLLTSGLSLANDATLANVVAGEHANSNGYARQLLGKKITAIDTSGDTLTISQHELTANQPVYLVTTGSAPGGLAIQTKYFVRNPLTNTLQLSATSGGSAIDISSAGSGTIVLRPGAVFDTGSDLRAEAAKDGADFVLSSSSTFQGFFIVANATSAIGSTTGAATLAGLGNTALLVGWEYLGSPQAITSKRVEININNANIGTGVGS